MDRRQDYTPVVAPREGVNDDFVRVLEWLVPEGDRVEEAQALVTLETTKAIFDLEAPRGGFVFQLAEAGAEVPVGKPVALVCDRPERPTLEAGPSVPAEHQAHGGQVVTKKARALVKEHGLDLALFADIPVLRTEDVEALIEQRQAQAAAQRPVRLFRGEPLDVDAPWDALGETELARRLKELLTFLRKRMKARFNRHVPTGELLHDRWELAKDHGFGEGTSVYDSCLILGDVTVGRNCWIGPDTILDGLHASLTIGDYVDIGAGAHVYTHNTIERALTGHRAPLFHRPTTIGSCCFIAPKTIIAPGTVLGDHCFVAAGSYVEGCFRSHSFLAGNPAKRVGEVDIKGERAQIRHFADK